MNQPTRGCIKKLTRLAKLKQYQSIRDRIFAVIYNKHKIVISTIAQMLHRSISWVKKWIKRYKEGGVENLFDKKRSGRPSILRQKFEDKFKERIIRGPLETDETSIFQGREIQMILESEFHSPYSISGVYALLHRLNFSLKIPRPTHYKQNPEEVKKWKDELPEELIEIVMDNPNKKIEIWYQDETRYGNQGILGKVWYPIGSKPSVKKQNGRTNAYIFGAVNPESGDHIGFISPECSTVSMNIHLDLISKNISKDSHAAIIMDGAPWHENSKEIVIPDNISIISLPSYSPELNPIERLWSHMKTKKLKNRIIDKNLDILDLGKELWNYITKKMVRTICSVSYI